jgi:DNA-binding transcriptional regulator YhcF (GntR family)
LSERNQGIKRLLSAAQIPTLKSVAQLLEVALAVLAEALEFLEDRGTGNRCC